MDILKISADKVFTSLGELEENAVVITDKSGRILEVGSVLDHDPASIIVKKGILTPGFINTHCHLELSHMKDKVHTGTGLLPFLKSVVSFRDIDQQTIDQAIADAHSEMLNNGIVAVGDISNKSDTASVKSHGDLSYYTFVEMFDFLQPSMTNQTIGQYAQVMEAQDSSHFNKKSFVPHAPYTVTEGLFDFVNDSNVEGNTVSIHNQETPDENELFIAGSGGFVEFYKGFGFNLDHFRPSGKSSIHYILQNLAPKFRTLFVHNTTTTEDDIRSAHAWNPGNCYWTTCPNANLYIENRLPDYSRFINTGATVTIGTDSLTSNWQLNIWEEIKTIRKFQSYVPLETCLSWATINGATALGYEDRLGSFEVGKIPGIVCLEGNIDDTMKLSPVRLL